MNITQRHMLFALGFTILLSALLFAGSTNLMSAQNQPTTPIAYGYINADGSVQTATGNIQAFYDAANGQYEIAIDGIAYFYNEFVSVVTASAASTEGPATMSTGSVNDNLLVFFLDVDGNRVQRDFQFVTFRP